MRRKPTDSYFEFCEQVFKSGAKVFGNKSRERRHLHWPQEWMGLEASLNSLSGAGYLHGKNSAFSQCVWGSAPKQKVPLGVPVYIQCANDLVDMSGELAEVLLWEPFFAGYLKVESAREFKQIRNHFLGFSAWLADAVVCFRIRGCTPLGELLQRRRNLAVYGFFPYRELAMAGLRKPEDQLKVYLHAFAKSRSYPLANKLAEFYGVGKSIPQPAYPRLHAIGLFSQFWPRFCHIPGLPSLFSRKDFAGLWSGGAEAYCLNMRRRGLTKMAQASAATVERVRERRALQTRAYFAMQIQKVITCGEFTSRQPLDIQECKSGLESYLAQLENILHQLAEGRSTAALIRARRVADRAYDETVRAPFERAQVRLGVKKRGKLLAIGKHFIYGQASAGLDFVNRFKDSMQISSDLERGVTYLQRKKRTSGATPARSPMEPIEAILRNKTLLEQWSPPLDRVSPEQNKYIDFINEFY